MSRTTTSRRRTLHPPRTPREKFAANITAIRTLKSIEKRMADGGPHANGEEQEILAQYSGWGGLSDAFEPNKDSWHNEYTELKKPAGRGRIRRCPQQHPDRLLHPSRSH